MSKRHQIDLGTTDFQEQTLPPKQPSSTPAPTSHRRSPLQTKHPKHQHPNLQTQPKPPTTSTPNPFNPKRPKPTYTQHTILDKPTKLPNHHST